MTEADRLAVFLHATRAFAHWYAQDIERGMTDDDIEAALRRSLGIMGGWGGPDTVAVMYQGAGLKIWGGWDMPALRDTPLFAGRMTIAMARTTYRIKEPSDRQLALF